MLKNRMFVKITGIFVVSLLITNILTLWATSIIFEKAFVKSYSLSNEKILNTISKDLERLNTQFIEIINQYSQNVYLQQYLKSDQQEDEKQLFFLFYEMKNSIGKIENTDTFSKFNMVVLGENGRLFTPSKIMLSEEARGLADHPITLSSMSKPSQMMYFYNKKGLIPDDKEKNYIIGVRQLHDSYKKQAFGTLYFNMKEEDFSEIYHSLTSEGNDISIIDKNGMVVSSSMKSLVGSPNSEMLQIANSNEENEVSYKVYKEQNQKYVVMKKYLPIYDMYLINTVNMKVIFEEYIYMKRLIFAGCFIITALTLILVFFMTRKVTKPLTKLVQHIKQNEIGEFSKISHIEGSYEVQEIQLAYNKMIEALEQYIEDLLEEQRQRRKAELKALQMQINPHFLYNTLATIKYLSWQENTKAVGETINALIALLQNTISKESEMITIEMEIENLKHYVTINQTRYGDAIAVNYYIDESCMQCKVPKLILQPFLENAFFHGYQEKEEGNIRVFIREKGEKLYCEILDDGDGIAEKDLPKGDPKHHFSGIGICNVDERIKMMYGSEYGVEISSQKGIGTKVVVIMPFS